MSIENSKEYERWKTKKAPLIENISEEIKFREMALYNLTQVEEEVSQVKETLREDITKLNYIEKIYTNEDAYVKLNPVNESAVDSVINISTSDLSNATRLVRYTNDVRNTMGALFVYANSSGSQVNTMGTLTTELSKNMKNVEGVSHYIELIMKPSSQDRRSELSKKLESINLRLSTKLEGAWQTIRDITKEDRFLQSASSARDLISDFLILLAPDEKVMGREWFKPETKNGKPSQRQRAKFVILGKNTIVSEEELKPINDLADNIRDTYEKLNPIAHLRDYENDLQGYSESLIDSCQIYLLKILEMREKYFQ